MDNVDTHPAPRRRTSLTEGRIKEAILIVSVIAIAVLLRFWNLQANGFGNVYYAAAARSGMSSFHNAVFASYDPAGFVSIDKPPIALWIQTISASVLGYTGWSLHLPQAIAGTTSILLLWRIIRRDFGRSAGIIAALTLAISPASVAVDRSNLPDSWLTFCLIASAGAFLCVVVRLPQRGREGKALLYGALLAGIAFQIKMLAAFVPLPAFLATIWYGASSTLVNRLIRSAFVMMIIVMISASWAVIVDIVPPASRPYVGGSQRNTVYDLIFGYNGLGRLIGGEGQFGTGAGSIIPDYAPPGLVAGGDPSITRLFRPVSAEQAMWLFPLAMCGLLRWALSRTGKTRHRRQLRQVLLWGGWAGLYFFVLSVSRGTYHPYYLSILTPALAALTGIAFSRFRVCVYEQNGGREYLVEKQVLMAGIITTALWQSYLLHFHGDRASIIITLLILSSLCGLIVAFGDFFDMALSPLAVQVLASATLMLLIAPLLWCFGAGEKRNSGLFPAARPPEFLISRTEKNATTYWKEPDETTDPVTVRYLLRHQGKSRFLCATPTVRFASAFIIETGRPVMAIGGFLGTDLILTLRDFQKKIEAGEIRFFLDTGEYRFPGAEENDRIQDYVRDSCREVPAIQWKSSADNSPMAGCRLFDCQSRPDQTAL